MFERIRDRYEKTSSISKGGQGVYYRFPSKTIGLIVIICFFVTNP